MLTVCPSSLKLNVSPFVSSLGACSDHSGSSVVVSSGIVSSVLSSLEDSSCDDVGVILSLGAWEDVSGTLSDELSVGTCKDVSGTLSVGASIVVSGIVAKASGVGLSNIVCSSIVCVCVSCLIISVVSSANEYCGM